MDMSSILRINDTTPRAKEKNNLTAYASVDLLNKVINSAKKQGVDPYAALAETWKENVFGNRNPKGSGTESGWINPMQYNAKDLAPKMSFKPGTSKKEQSRILHEASEKAFDDKVTAAVLASPRYNKATDEYASAYKQGDYISLDKARQVKTNVDAAFKDAMQDAYIDGGVGYLGKMMKKSPDLTQAFAGYRGKGQAAAYHGRHTKELYDSLKNNPDIIRMVGR
jgi:hypothetical protein